MTELSKQLGEVVRDLTAVRLAPLPKSKVRRMIMKLLDLQKYELWNEVLDAPGDLHCGNAVNLGHLYTILGKQKKK